MYEDKANRGISSSDGVKVSMPISEDRVARRIDETKHWKTTDVLIHSDGHKEVREGFNTVVEDCSKLIACLMKGQAGHKGIAYWAVSKGGSDWDNENPPSPVESDSSLVTETYRKAIKPEDIVFLDSENQPTDQVTNKIQITVVFEEGEANGELREFGLYGGDATEETGSGIMINRKTHGLIYKTSGMKLERSIRIIL